MVTEGNSRKKAELVPNPFAPSFVPVLRFIGFAPQGLQMDERLRFALKLSFTALVFSEP